MGNTKGNTNTKLALRINNYLTERHICFENNSTLLLLFHHCCNQILHNTHCCHFRYNQFLLFQLWNNGISITINQLIPEEDKHKDREVSPEDERSRALISSIWSRVMQGTAGA